MLKHYNKALINKIEADLYNNLWFGIMYKHETENIIIRFHK